MTAADIITAARAALGTPFQHQGRIPGIALDCAGLVVHVANAIGADYTDVDGYSRFPANGLLQSTLDSQPCLERVAIADRQAGDILLFRFSGDPQHLGIFTGDSIIHAYSNVGQVCEHRLASVWSARIVRVYRFKGLA